MAFAANKLYVLPVLVVLIIFQILGSEHPGNYSSVVTRQQHLNDHRSSSLLLTTAATDNGVSSETKFCSPEEVVDGGWIPKTLPKPPYIPLSPRVRCLRTEDFSRPFSTYVWKPNSPCHLVDWSPFEFCQGVGNNQTISFIGDSLTLEHYASLVHLLGDRARLPPKAVQHGRIQRPICVSNNVDNNKQQCCFNVVFRTDFFLTNLTAEIQQTATTTVSTMPQASPMPRVLVLNRGAHYVSNGELISSLQTHTLPSILEWNQKCQSTTTTTTASKNSNKCLLIWRTTVPGHPYCRNFTRPSQSVSDMQRWIEETSIKDPNGPYKKGEYHWQDFARQNRLIVDLLLHRWQPQLSYVEIQIMDSYKSNILRPDNHRSHMNDCLHSCSPGGGSDWNTQWLLHILVARYI